MKSLERRNRCEIRHDSPIQHTHPSSAKSGINEALNFDSLLEDEVLTTITLQSAGGGAKRCSHALIKEFLFDPDPKVFEALLVNQRLREDDLLVVANSDRASPAQLQLLAADTKWSYRYAIRKALVMNPLTPRSAAASMLRFLSKRDLEMIHDHPRTTIYVRRCIERLQPDDYNLAIDA